MVTNHSSRYYSGMKLSAWLAMALCFASLGRLLAEPLNFMVGDLTFTRPQNWVWEEPSEKSAAVSQFRIQAPELKNSTLISCYYTKLRFDGVKEKWKSDFKLLEESSEETVTMGKRAVTYFSGRGTYGSRPGIKTFGVLIPHGKRTITLKMVGLRAEVEKHQADLKKIVEEAVRSAGE